MKTVSVVINTFNRAASLRDALIGLSKIDYPNFEVIVVNGPSTDDTQSVLAEFGRKIKAGFCPERNLSKSRNIGISLAAGEIIAFMDDDAVPSTRWLCDIVPLFDDPAVGLAGGRVWNHTGRVVQAHQIICDRFGGAKVFDHPISDPADVNFPFSPRFWSTLGTNSLFRRAALVEIGGFDEEYDYFLDETDVCIRLNDFGWIGRFSKVGDIYHRYRASHLRNDHNAIRDWRSILKNKAYFAMRYGMPYFSLAAAANNIEAYCRDARASSEAAEAVGALPFGTTDDFDRYAPYAIQTGVQRSSQPIRTCITKGAAEPVLDWKPFPVALAASERLHLCFLSQDYPPGVTMGIGRVTHELATGLAAKGHIVRVIAKGQDHPTVDFENGVWVHRIPHASALAPKPSECPDVPDHVWGRSLAVREELQRIASLERIDLVQGPNWDAEGLALLLDIERPWPFVLGVYTPMLSAIEHNSSWKSDLALQQSVLMPIARAETICYKRADALLACGHAILDEVSQRYKVPFAGRSVGLVPHGLPDLGASAVPSEEKATVDVLFVGRLEERKGIDVLFSAIARLADLENVNFLVAGNDRFITSSGKTWRQIFESAAETAAYRHRVRFFGQVSDDELDGLYRQCDLVVVPSRYESFGLPIVEGMMRQRAIICADIGGMTELIDSGKTGLIFASENAEELANALRLLILSREMRTRFSLAARHAFLTRFTKERMVNDAEDFYRSVLDGSAPTYSAVSHVMKQI
ncbi:MAG: group 1 glycosyl [Beijerinckiaceae bacterium]|nr:MAG: group 1 glycosyl [Beijerinckiaceae bacterium]